MLWQTLGRDVIFTVMTAVVYMIGGVPKLSATRCCVSLLCKGMQNSLQPPHQACK